MSNDAYRDATAVQEKVLDAIKQGQEATLSAVRDATEAFTTAWPKMPEWVESFTSALPKLPEWAEAYTPKLPDLPLPDLESVLDFSQKIWENQRQFNLKLYEAVAPIGTSAFVAAKDTAKSAKVPTDAARSEQAKAGAEHITKATTPKA